MTTYSDNEGTFENVFKIGQKGSRIEIRSNGGVFEFRDSGGAWINPGTMTPQDADNVDISGGVINGTTIGATTPSSGVFSSLKVDSGANDYTFPTIDGIANQLLQTDGSGVLTWEDKPSGYFELDTGSTPDRVVQPSGAVYDEDFVFGSPSLDDDLNVNHDSRFFFDESLSAFRAGKTTGTEWDTRGQYSAGFGLNCQSSGMYSFAGGNNVVTSNTYGFSWGSSISNQGQYTVAFGTGHSIVTGDRGLVSGSNQSITALGCVAHGWGHVISADYGFATGDHILLDEKNGVGLGRYCASTKYSTIVHASGTHSSQGYNQTEKVHNLGTTNGNIITTLYPGNSSSNAMSIPDDNTVYGFTLRVIGVVTVKAGVPDVGDVIDIDIKGTVIRMSSSVFKIAHIPVDIYRHTNLSACLVELNATGVNTFQVRVTGIASTTIVWNAYMTIHELRW